LLVADAFPPMRTSAAVLLHDLACEMSNQGHDVTVMIPAPGQTEPWSISDERFGRVLRIKTPGTKDIGYVQRTLAEFYLPFIMYSRFKRSSLFNRPIDGVVFYSPSIFFGPLIRRLKKHFGCKAYLIVRDMFPDWALDLGLLRKGPPYYLLKQVERNQYQVADTIGVQCPGNLALLSANPGISCKAEVLWNWMGPAASSSIECPIRLSDTPLRGRKVFVYAGNMGVAQGMGAFMELAERLLQRTDIGFLFVGRGSDAQLLRESAASKGLNNVAFFDEIDPSEIPALYAQCHVGLVALDPRHKTHNIPGKFLSYMQCGLPVLASINPGNDLVELIRSERVGKVSVSSSAQELADLALALMDEVDSDADIAMRCKALSDRLFSPVTTVQQIVRALQ
jgi:glycosyltransferase involved in cell wall biosynthesis